MKGLTDIAGIRVGHATDLEGLTGCTVAICEKGARAGYDIRGGASGTQEMDVMSPLHVTPAVHAVVFAGGSAFGLEAASGVRRYLEKGGIGFSTGAARVPIVPAAIIYDLGIGSAQARPTREMGEVAAASAHEGPVEEGCVGAGAGATVGKILGLRHAMKSGVGSSTVQLGSGFPGVLVSALVVVNAFGDVLENGRIVAGARATAGGSEFADTARRLLERGPSGGFGRTNTSLILVATNARLSKVEATHVAQRSHHGLVRSVSPVHTTMDGDLAIALSCGSLEAPVDSLSAAAAEAVAQAVVRAVRAARPLGGLPGLAGQ